jgi:hypothetical protein
MGKAKVGETLIAAPKLQDKENNSGNMYHKPRAYY